MTGRRNHRRIRNMACIEHVVESSIDALADSCKCDPYTFKVGKAAHRADAGNSKNYLIPTKNLVTKSSDYKALIVTVMCAGDNNGVKHFTHI
jgi:hypothetical protein